MGVVLVENGRGRYCKKGIPHAEVDICVVLLDVERKSCLRRFALLAKFLDLNKPWSCKINMVEKNEKSDMYDIPVPDCTQKQNSSPS